MAGLIQAGQIPTAGLLSVVQETANASADLSLTSTITDITGATVTLAAQTDSAFFLAWATFDMDKTSTSASAVFAEGILDVDGDDQAGEVLAKVNLAAVARMSVARSWSGTLSAGSHTWKLQGQAATSDIWVCRSVHTCLTVIVFG